MTLLSIGRVARTIRANSNEEGRVSCGEVVEIMHRNLTEVGGLDELLDDRGKTHGRWRDNARIAQSMKELWRREDGWKRLSEGQRECLEMIAHKIARVLAGDPNHIDHWADIGGYAELVVRELNG